MTDQEPTLIPLRENVTVACFEAVEKLMASIGPAIGPACFHFNCNAFEMSVATANSFASHLSIIVATAASMRVRLAQKGQGDPFTWEDHANMVEQLGACTRNAFIHLFDEQIAALRQEALEGRGLPQEITNA